MKQICVGGVLPASAVSLGCMRINTLQEGEAAALLATAMEKGIDFSTTPISMAAENRSGCLPGR